MLISVPEESSKVVIETIQNEIKRLREKTASFQKQLNDYEQQFHLKSDVFLKKFDNGELGDDQIFFEWYAALQTFYRIKERLISLEKVKLD